MMKTRHLAGRCRARAARVARVAYPVAIIFALLAAVLVPARAVRAATAVPDLSRTGSISLTPRATDSGHGVVDGLEFTLYRVAEVACTEGELSYSATADFAAAGADLSNPGSAALAESLAAYAEEQGLSGTRGTSGIDGTVTFGDLPLGLYLVVQANAGSAAYSAGPFLVTVPVKATDGAGWTYSVDASPKMELRSTTSISVRKVWNDGNDASARPASVSVTLYRGGTAVDTVELSASNSWSHTWEGLEASDSYTVEEAACEGYVATYSQEGGAFTVTNTAKLVQTGQLKWPIPVLAAGGLLLFALGWYLVNDSKRDCP